ncbi:Aste57867_20638 [Aphanomyces stellatus]|uniref:Aste57867_20638 protein n=1 Tax=Aphanomyces stellatus TaxID=120398 RepID=A0A485LFJ5_9STRA|nr:hypothetical protein As57867_020570 [Aphanomyces stellatus]VFT97318.1 Aste57867_20638 [Aphanomyces stellatus]
MLPGAIAENETLQSFVRPIQDAVDATDLVNASIVVTSNQSAAPTANRTKRRRQTRRAVEVLLGYLYIVGTLTASVSYLSLLASSLTNDLWWPSLNATGVQSYLIDLVNAGLTANASTSLFAPGLPQDYSQVETFIALSPTYARSLLDAPWTDLAVVISSLRATPSPETTLSTQFCWVDFDRVWDVAHTDRRQARCNRFYTANAAMYWETIVRNVDFDEWTARVGGPTGAFTATIGHALQKSTAGKAWLYSVAHASLAVVDEAAYWRQHAITFFQVSYSNVNQQGIDETIAVVNSFGLTQHVTLKRVVFKTRGSDWTTAFMCWGPSNDLGFAQAYGYSLVRSDPAHVRFLATPCPTSINCDTPNFGQAFGLNDTAPFVELARAALGPFGSVDLFLVAVPSSLQALATTFHAAFAAGLASTDNEFRAAVAAVPTLPMDPVPRSWATDPTMRYMGGDPTCPARLPLPFVQSSFGFNGACTHQTRHTVTAGATNLVFAMLSAAPRGEATASSCALCPTLMSNCMMTSSAAIAAVAALPPIDGWAMLVAAAVADVASIAPKFIQYGVSASGTPTFFQHEMLLPPSDAYANWNVFGWLYLLDWALGLREVVSFQGDVNTFALVSDAYAPFPAQAQPLEIPRTACQYLWYLSLYVSACLLSVGFLLLAYGAAESFSIAGRSLLQFNRLVGAVWVGRPFLVLRGMTALILMSTSPVAFERVHDSISRFRFASRPLVDSMVVAGEATWLTYVANDILLPLFPIEHAVAAPLTSLVMFLLGTFFDFFRPFEATMTLTRTCTPLHVDATIVCSSGQVALGDISRVVWFLAANVAVMVTVYAVTRMVVLCRASDDPRCPTSHLLLSGTAEACFAATRTGVLIGREEDDDDDDEFLVIDDGTLQLDQVECAMAGLLCFGSSIFDLKLWTFVHDPLHWGDHQRTNDRSSVRKVFRPPNLLPTYDGPVQWVRDGGLMAPTSSRWHTLTAFAGLAYLCLTLLGSVSYILVSDVNMSNDFWWASFNGTGAHLYLSNFFNDNAVLRPALGVVRLDDNRFLDPTFDYSGNATTTAVPQLYAASVQIDQSHALEAVVRGLRTMDACLIPWIATQYCWLDFARSWTMARTSARQARCLNAYVTNGAVYLESVLRNAHWPQLRSCWGTSLDVGIGAAMAKSSNKGAAWWAQVQTIQTADADEATYWTTAAGIVHFTPDWQNYKMLGVVETYSIENAFGFSYAMTLKRSHSSFLGGVQTSFIFSWPFACDLWAVVAPNTLLTNTSLVRPMASSAASFPNMQAVLVQNGTLTVPPGGGLAAVQSRLGPFGSIDIHHVPIPASLVRFYTTTRDRLFTSIRTNAAIRDAYALLRDSPQYSPVPRPWLQATNLVGAGGNLLCPDVAGSPFSYGLYWFTGFISSCGIASTGDGVTPTKLHTLLGVLATHMLDANDTDVVASSQLVTWIDPALWLAHVRPAIAFWRNTSLFAVDTFHADVVALARAAAADLGGISVAQYALNTSAPSPDVVSLLTTPLLDPTQPDYAIFAWLYFFEWLEMRREVLAVHGDVDSLTLVSSALQPERGAFNSLEVPRNVAATLRLACIYITATLALVALLATVYLVSSHLATEGLNLFEFNRVVGLVWIGRPLLLLRGVTAIALLATAKLELTRADGLTFWEEPRDATVLARVQSSFKTVLASGEGCWLVFVATDVLTPVTRHYTSTYAIKTSVMVWVAAAALSFASPLTHAAVVQRTCTPEAVDFQFVCSAGSVTIGSAARFYLFVGLPAAAAVGCFLVDRLRFPRLKHSQLPPPHPSFLLSSTAKYMYEARRWTLDGVYHLDPASAAMNGLLSFRHGDRIALFDVKTWKVMVVGLPECRREIFDVLGLPHLHMAVPLIE